MGSVGRSVVQFTVSWMLLHWKFCVSKNIHTWSNKYLCCALSSQTISIEEMAKMNKTRHINTYTRTHQSVSMKKTVYKVRCIDATIHIRHTLCRKSQEIHFEKYLIESEATSKADRFVLIGLSTIDNYITEPEKCIIASVFVCVCFATTDFYRWFTWLHLLYVPIPNRFVLLQC